MADLIERDDTIKAILNLTSCESVRELFEFTQNYGLVNSWGGGISDAIDAVIRLPSAQQEIKPIEYRECADAMLKMWMDKVVTDGEYNRIMDKLNAHWGRYNG